MNAAKMNHFGATANSRLWSSSFFERRRRVLREARPRLMSRLRLRKSSMALLPRSRRQVRGRPMLLIRADHSADEFVPDDVTLGEIDERNSLHVFQGLERFN